MIKLQVSEATDTEKQTVPSTLGSPRILRHNSDKWEALIGVVERESASLKRKKRRRRRMEANKASSKKRYQILKQKGGAEYKMMLERKRQNERQRKKRNALERTEEEKNQFRLSENQRNRKLYVKRKEKIGYASRKTQRLAMIRGLMEEGKHTPEHLEELETAKRMRRVKYQKEKAKRALKKKQIDRTPHGQNL